MTSAAKSETKANKVVDKALQLREKNENKKQKKPEKAEQLTEIVSSPLTMDL